MSLDNTKLFDFLGEIDKELPRKIIVVAVGGTAMTLVNAKPSTIDVDFTILGEDYDEFERAKKIVQPGFRVDVFRDGAVFVTILPDDYLDKSKSIATNLKNIDLRALDPVDIIITKIARLDGRDEQDIESCIANFQITQKQIEQRAKNMNCAGNDEVFVNNLKTVLGKFFKE